MHYAIDHIEEYIEAQGQGFSLFSEQTGKAIYAEFQKTWLHYLVKHAKGENFLRATIAFNSLHV